MRVLDDLLVGESAIIADRDAGPGPSVENLYMISEEESFILRHERGAKNRFAGEIGNRNCTQHFKGPLAIVKTLPDLIPERNQFVG